jgi:hypothetical protein
MMAKVGAAARHSQSAAPRAVPSTPPQADLVASLGRAVEPLEHAPEAVQSARIGRIGVVNHAIFQQEGAQARPLAHLGGRVGAGHGRVLDEDLRDRRRRTDAAAPVIVFTAALALLLFGERDVEVEVKLPADR